MNRFIVTVQLIVVISLQCFSKAKNEPVPDPLVPKQEPSTTKLPQQIQSRDTISSTNNELLSKGKFVATSRIDRDYLARISGYAFQHKDSVILKYSITNDANSKYQYQILRNDSTVWQLALKTPASELETMIVRASHNTQLGVIASEKKELQRGYYEVTPWKSIPPLLKEKNVSQKMKNWFAWEAGASVEFTREHNYNFNKVAGDTSEVFIDLGKPVIYDHKLISNYTHRFGNIWVGTGIERSWQKSSRFDSLYVSRDTWFTRMGWNVNFAVPGFRYKLYRDPGVIPFYSKYEDSLYTKLYPGAKYKFTRELGITKDSILQTKTIDLGPVSIDALDTVNRIDNLKGLAHEFTLKIGYLHYLINIHPVAYVAPIHTIGMIDMPFFKGDWDLKLIYLPDGKLIPHGSIDFYRTSIKLGRYDLGISPFQFEIELWDRLGFYTSLGFNAELLTKNARFDEDQI